MPGNKPFQPKPNRTEHETKIRELENELAKINRQLTEIEVVQRETDEHEIYNLLEEHKYIDAYNSSYGFLTNAWHTFEPSEFVPAKHLHAIGEHLDACLRGEIRHLAINIPPRCLAKGTEVLMSDNSYKKIEDIKVGDYVYSYDNNKLTDEIVTRTIVSGKKECLELLLSDGNRISCSKDHKIYTMRGWIEAQHLKEHDVVITPRKFKHSPNLIPLDDAFLLGVWVAEGFKANRSAFAFANNDPELINRVINIGKNKGWRYRYDKEYTHRLINNEALKRGTGLKGNIRKWFEFYFPNNEHPKNCYNTRVPSIIFKSSNSVKIEFLNAYIACDGCVSGEKIFSCSASEGLTYDIYRLFKQLGFQPTLKRIKAGKSKTPYGIVNKSVAYYCSISGNRDLQKAKEIFTFVHKLDRLDKLTTHKRNNKREIPTSILDLSKLDCRARYAMKKNRFIPEEKLEKEALDKQYVEQIKAREINYLEIKQIRDIGKLECYDLTINNTECFFANDILVHNCSKSSLVTKAFPAYCWLKDGGKRIINISYSKRLAENDSLMTRQIVESEWYQKGLTTVWKELNEWESVWSLSKTQNTKEDYRTTWDGRRFATSTGGTLTGVGGDIIIIDDPLNPDMAHSKVERENCNNWASETLPSRLDNKLTGCMILVQQRLHEQDLTGYFLEQGIWEHLFIPLEWEESRRFWTNIGWTDWRTKEGELMDEVRHPRQVVEELKLKGEYAYAAQYQQNPAPLGGGLIKESWWQTWYILPQTFDSMCMAFDLSFKGDVTSDNNALIVVGRKDNRFYIIDLVYGKMDIIEQIEAIERLCEKHPYVRTKLIEDKANGSAAWTMLQRKITGLNKVDPKGISKEVRIMSMIPEINAGNVYIPDPEVHPWIKPLLAEARMFPKGKYDDSMDVLAYSIDYLNNHSNFTRMPIEVITETKDVISRNEVRQYLESNYYNTPIQVSRNYVQGLFN